MGLLPWSLVIFSGLIHSLWNLKVKQVENRSLFLAVAFFFAALAVLPVAVAMGGLYLPKPSLIPALLSSVAESAYVLSLAKAYSVSDISFVYPIARGSAPLWSSAAGVIFLSERLSGTGVLGIAAVIAGIIVTSFNIKKGSTGSLFLSLLVGLFISVYTCMDRLAVEYASLWSLLFCKFIVSGTILLAINSRQKYFVNNIKNRLGTSFLVGVASLSAYSLVLLAMQHSSLGYVAVGRETGIAFAAVFGFVFLKEKLNIRGVAGVILIFTGIALLKFA